MAEQLVSHSTSRDTCTMNQNCLNSGTCEPPNNEIDYNHCVCQPGYSGLRCSKYCPLECQNKGVCTWKPTGGAVGNQAHSLSFDPSDYICKCYGRFTGRLCETQYSNCGSQTKCYHGGECIPIDDHAYAQGHRCRCPSGYTGVWCETRIDPNADGPFKTGAGVGSFSVFMVFVVSVLLLLCVRCCPRLRQWRRRVKFQEFAGESVDDEVDAIMRDVLGSNHNSSQPLSLLKWPAKEKLHTQRKGVELHNLQP